MMDKERSGKVVLTKMRESTVRTKHIVAGL